MLAMALPLGGISYRVRDLSSSIKGGLHPARPRLRRVAAVVQRRVVFSEADFARGELHMRVRIFKPRASIL